MMKRNFCVRLIRDTQWKFETTGNDSVRGFHNCGRIRFTLGHSTLVEDVECFRTDGRSVYFRCTEQNDVSLSNHGISLKASQSLRNATMFSVRVATSSQRRSISAPSFVGRDSKSGRFRGSNTRTETTSETSRIFCCGDI